MLRITPANQEYIYIHAFGGRNPQPGKLCDGENKVILVVTFLYVGNIVTPICGVLEQLQRCAIGYSYKL